MNVLDAFILGIVQGLTEFLPVSSSGHLVIAQTLLRHDATPGVFLEVALHVASLLAVVLVYRRRLLRILVGAVRRDDGAWRYIGLLAVATLPAAVVGLSLHDVIGVIFDTPAVAGTMLLVTGILLWSTRYIPRDRLREEPGWGLALAMGVAQAFAILPGISRAGSSIVTGLWGRVSGERVAEFSFLMAIPAIAGAGLLEARNLAGGIENIGAIPLLVGFLASLLSSIAAILLLVWLIRRQVFYAFSFYVWPAGLLFLLYLWLQ